MAKVSIAGLEPTSPGWRLERHEVLNPGGVYSTILRQLN